MTVGEPPLGGWRSFRWVGQHPAAEHQRAVELDETTARYMSESRARRGARMTVRDRLVTGALAGTFLLTASVIAVVVDSARRASAITVALLVLAYAYASRVDVELGAGSAVPTGLVLIRCSFCCPSARYRSGSPPVMCSEHCPTT